MKSKKAVAPSKFSVDTSSGLLEPVTFIESPNQDARPEGCEPDLLILHGISLPPASYGGRFIDDLFTNRLDWDAHPYFDEIRHLRVSSHLLIRRDGELVQFVPFHCRAWHAGESRFRGSARCNDFSIGLELEGSDDEPYDDRQYATLIPVCRAIVAAFEGIDARRIAGHCDVSPGRKTDPGPAFDWLRLYDGLAA